MKTLREVVIEYDLLRLPVKVDGAVVKGSLFVTTGDSRRLPADLWHCSDYAVRSTMAAETVCMVRRGYVG